MSGGIGQHFANLIGGFLLGDTSFTPPSTWYAAMMTANPTDAGGGTEASGGGYARIAIANNTTNFPAWSAGATQTGTVIDFGTFTADIGTVVGIAFYDASTGGNLAVWGPLTNNRLVLNGDGFKILANGGTFTVV